MTLETSPGNKCNLNTKAQLHHSTHQNQMDNTWYSFQHELENLQGNIQSFPLTLDEENLSQEQEYDSEEEYGYDETSSSFKDSYEIPMEADINNYLQSFRPLGVIIQKDSKHIVEQFHLFNFFGIFKEQRYGQAGVISIGRTKHQDIYIDRSDVQASKEHCQIITTCLSSSGQSKSLSILEESHAPLITQKLCKLKEKFEDKGLKQYQERLFEKNRQGKGLRLLKGWIERKTFKELRDEATAGADSQLALMITCLGEESIFQNICEFVSKPNGLHLLDLETKLGTQIQVDHIHPSQLLSGQSYIIGQSQKFQVNEINDLRYFDDFACVIAECILECMKLTCLNYNINTVFSENARVFMGLKNKDLQQFEEIYRFVSKELVISFSKLGDHEYLEKFLKQIKESLKSFSKEQNARLMGFRPYVKLKFQIDEGRKHRISFFLFDDGSDIDRVFTIGRDGCDILINSREVSRKNSEIYNKQKQKRKNISFGGFLFTNCLMQCKLFVNGNQQEQQVVHSRWFRIRFCQEIELKQDMEESNTIELVCES